MKFDPNRPDPVSIYDSVPVIASASASLSVPDTETETETETPALQRAGFSLIELMAVMVILAILMTFLAFRLGALGGVAKQRNTETYLAQFTGAAKNFEQETGAYPPSSWQSDWGPAPNKTNLGVEALCLALWAKDYGGSGISDDRLGNTDEDEAKKSLTTHGNNDLFELIDDWQNPIAYFYRQDYGREDLYMTQNKQGEWDSSTVKALKSSKTGNYYNARSFQLISAGEDGIFGTDDDLFNFERVDEEGE
jgi:prepilin-type N-terminal cleavage/methylation domain-containing protein